MSQNENPKQIPELRLEIIKRGLLEGQTQEEMAEEAGVCRKTINRDIRRWELTGGFEDWLRREFKDLSAELIEEEKPLVYREISKLAARTMTQRTESKVEGFGTLLIWRPDDKEPNDKPEDEDQNT